MTDTIGHHQPSDPQHHIVSCHLIEHTFGDSDCGSLVLDDGDRPGRSIIDHSVAPAQIAIMTDPNLICHKSGGITPIFDKEIHKMLSDPLLGSESNEFSTQAIGHLQVTVSGTPQGYIKFRQIEFQKKYIF